MNRNNQQSVPLDRWYAQWFTTKRLQCLTSNQHFFVQGHRPQLWQSAYFLSFFLFSFFLFINNDRLLPRARGTEEHEAEDRMEKRMESFNDPLATRLFELHRDNNSPRGKRGGRKPISNSATGRLNDGSNKAAVLGAIYCMGELIIVSINHYSCRLGCWEATQTLPLHCSVRYSNRTNPRRDGSVARLSCLTSASLA